MRIKAKLTHKTASFLLEFCESYILQKTTRQRFFAAAEENGTRRAVAGDDFHLADEGIHVAIHRRDIRCVRVKRTITALARAKGHVDVEALNGHERV